VGLTHSIACACVGNKDLWDNPLVLLCFSLNPKGNGITGYIPIPRALWDSSVGKAIWDSGIAHWVKYYGIVG